MGYGNIEHTEEHITITIKSSRHIYKTQQTSNGNSRNRIAVEIFRTLFESTVILAKLLVK